MKLKREIPHPFRLSLLLACAGLALIAAGCYATSSGYSSGYATSGPAVVATDDYVYYPDYEVYYSNTRHNYVYRDHDRWVTRASPPRGWAGNSVSVHMNWHDSPERHHTEVVRSYPKNWRPRAEAPHRERDHDHDGDRDHDRDDRHH